jgi:hypothetical protein
MLCFRIACVILFYIIKDEKPGSFSTAARQLLREAAFGPLPTAEAVDKLLFSFLSPGLLATAADQLCHFYRAAPDQLFHRAPTASDLLATAVFQLFHLSPAAPSVGLACTQALCKHMM